MFLNYYQNKLSVNTYRAPNAAVGELGDVLLAHSKSSGEMICCSIDDDTIDLLESSTYWQGSDVTSDSVETAYDLINQEG